MLYTISKIRKSTIHCFKRCAIRSWNEEVAAIASQSLRAEGSILQSAAKSPFCCEVIPQPFCTVGCVSSWSCPTYTTRGKLGTSRWKPTSQPCEFSLLLRKYFAALLSVWEISQTPFFSCEMVPGASRYLLPTLRDILHQIFCCLNPKILLVSHQLQDSLAFKLVKRENIYVIISFILCSYKYLSRACSQRGDPL